MLVQIFRKPKMLFFDLKQQNKDSNHSAFPQYSPLDLLSELTNTLSQLRAVPAPSICHILPHPILELAEQQQFSSKCFSMKPSYRL
jgi:hypothetical protein